jgi:cyanophycinase
MKVKKKKKVLVTQESLRAPHRQNGRLATHPVAKGILMPIGGGEDKKENKTVLGRFIEETGKNRPRVVVVTVATSLPKEVAADYRSAFRNLGIEEIGIVHFDVRRDADKEKYIEMVRKCDAVLFSGGDQLRLSSLLGGTRLMKIIRRRYIEETDFVIAGTSAGAAAMSDTMIIAGSSKDAMIKGELELTNGLDLIDNVFIDTHFMERGRFGRLIQTVTCNPGILGVGLGEDTAAVIYDGNVMEVVGSGLVVIVDGIGITYTDLTDVSNGEPITVEGLKMHILGPGKRFLLNERKVAPVIAKTEDKAS